MINSLQLNPWLNELLEAGLEPEEVLTIIRSFLDTAPAILVEAQQYLDNRELKAAGRAAHRLVGGAANVGTTRLEALARDLERTCEAEDHDRAAQILEALRTEYDTAGKELELTTTLLLSA